jgi:hypothetical protein
VEGLVPGVVDRILSIYTNGLLTYMIDLGYRTGLFEAAAAGPATSQALAERARLQERYVREWLGSIVANGIMAYDPDTREYMLPPEHAASLTGAGSANMAPTAGMVVIYGKHLTELEHAFRVGGGVPYSRFGPEWAEKMDQVSRRPVDELLVDRWLPLVPGLPQRFTAGARVADIGCGSGHATCTTSPRALTPSASRANRVLPNCAARAARTAPQPR